MKTLTWPTTTSSTTTTKLYAMAHHINLLNTPINNSKPRHGHATIEGGRSPPYPPGRARVEWTRNHVRVRLWVRVWVLVRALNLGAQVLSELWGTVRFRFQFRFRRFTSSGHWATLGRTVCRTSKSNYPYKYWTLSAIVDETLWLVSIWFMRSCRKGKKAKTLWKSNDLTTM